MPTPTIMPTIVGPAALETAGPIGVVAQAEVDLETLDEALGAGGLTGWDWAQAGFIVLGGVIVARLLRWLLGRLLRRTTNPTVADLIARLAAIVVGAFALVYALETLGVRIGPLLGALGIVGIAVAFALKDVLENFVAGLLLQFRRPFDYGDEIVSGDTEGTVTSIDARTVTIETPDGETVHLPSSKVITDAIVNHTSRGRRRTTLPVGVAYGTDLERALRVFRAALDGLDDVAVDPAPEVLVRGFGDSSIDLVVRYWHEPSIAAFWRAQHAAALAIDDACRRHQIEIPFPQRTVWWGDGADADTTTERRATRQEITMGQDHGPSIQDDEQYESLREDGMSKAKAAAIANSDRTETARRGGESPAYEEWTRDELYERAKELDIDGRSSMTKDELIDALRR